MERSKRNLVPRKLAWQNTYKIKKKSNTFGIEKETMTAISISAGGAILIMFSILGYLFIRYFLMGEGEDSNEANSFLPKLEELIGKEQ